MDAGSHEVDPGRETLAIYHLEFLRKREQSSMSFANIIQSDSVLIHESNTEDQLTEI
jgi:hypothetical protein